MGEIYETARIPERLHQPLRLALNGQAGEWPADLTEIEIQALAEHGVVPLVYRVAHVPGLRELAIWAAAIEHQRLADLRDVLAALAVRDVDVLILKGTAL